jgi:PAS domain S-box-containing protein
MFKLFKWFYNKKIKQLNYKILDNIYYGVIIVNKNGNIVYCNKKSQNIFGYNIEELISNNISILVPDYYKTTHLDNIKNYTTKSLHIMGKDRNIQGKHKDNSLINIQITLNSIKNHILIFIQDKSIEIENLQKITHLKNTLSDAETIAKIGSFKYNIDTNQLFVTKGFNTIYNIEKEIITFEELINPNIITDYILIQNEFSKCIQTKQSFEHYYSIEIENTIKDILLKCKYINTNCITGIIQDITIQKNIENKLIEAKQNAERASDMKSLFVANMSHEIRTPINGIIGMASLLQNENLTNDQQENINIIIESSGILLSIVNNILDFSKIESGKMFLEYLDFNLHDLLNNLKLSFKQQIEQKKLYFNIYINNNVPINIKSDQIKLRQILTNLINNAIKFTDIGSITITVENINNFLKFKVKDTGIGIKNTSNIFEPFTQADVTTTRQFGGTGLGLSICKNLVNLMGGIIDIISNWDNGTLVYFTIPFDNSLKQNSNNLINNIQELQINEYITNDDFKNDIIIIVDDNLINQKVTQKMINSIGYNNILLFNNGKDAYEKIINIKENIILILMDLHMPIMDGYTCAIQLRKYNITTPIIAITANSMMGVKEKCLNIGMNDVLIKPIQVLDIKKIMFQILKNNTM